MIASTNYAAVTLIAAGGALIVGIVVVLVLRHRAKGTRAEIPAGMRPGPSDQALETPLLLKLQGWGVVLVTFFVLWFPVMWLVEPGDEPQAGAGARHRRDRTRTAGDPALLRGEPARASGACGATATSSRAA